MRTHSRKNIVLVAGVLLLVGSGAAYAYWTTTGSGSATGTSANGLASPLTVSQQGSVTGLAPGGLPQDVNFTLINGAATPQYATTVVMAISGITWTSAAGAPTGTTLANHPAGATPLGCTSADFTLTQPTAGVDVPPAGLAFTQATSGRTGGRIAMANLGTNQDDCKGVTVALSLTIT